MRWRVVWTTRALREGDRFDPRVRERLTAAIDLYASEERGDVRRLKDVEPSEWRLRVGNWRVRFSLDREARILYVVRVLPRDQAYR